MKTETIRGVYDKGAIRFHTTLKLGRKLPLPDQTLIRFQVEWPRPSRSGAMGSFSLLRAPKRLARLIAESPELSVLNT